MLRSKTEGQRLIAVLGGTLILRWLGLDFHRCTFAIMPLHDAPHESG